MAAEHRDQDNQTDLAGTAGGQQFLEPAVAVAARLREISARVLQANREFDQLLLASEHCFLRAR